MNQDFRLEEMKAFSMDYFSLKGKVAIVTGGATGIGQAYSLALAKAGANLVVSTHNLPPNETEELLKSCGIDYAFVQGDLTDSTHRKELINTALEKFGRLDILVNNSGAIRRAPLLSYPEEDWNHVLDLNLNALYFLSQEVANIFAKQGGGKIINVASMLSYQGGKFVPSYTASKHAVVGLTKAFCNELAEKNIQVNAIAPGYVISNNTKPILEDGQRYEEILSRIPANRWANTSDLMGAIIFLSSKASDYVNGHVLVVDGGWLSR